MVSPIAPKGSVQLSFYDWEGRAELAGALKTCQEAIAGSWLLSFGYTDRSGTPTTRTVEPYQLHFSESSWYLKGFCLERMGGHGCSSSPGWSSWSGRNRSSAPERTC
ncbi:WYL domain-containing protein [Paenibacillus rhizoplanae]